MSYRGVHKPKTKINNSRSSDRRMAAGRAPASYLHTAVQSPLLNTNNNNNNSNNRSNSPYTNTSPIAGNSPSPSPGASQPLPGFQYVSPTTTASADGASKAPEKIKTVQRKVGSQTWSDSTLLEWDPKHFRLFVGNLGQDANDEMLYRAFLKYPSLSKVRVPMDPKSKVNRGYGFAAFVDPEDYFKAFKEMNGKYIGQHPVQLKRAQTEIKPVTVKNKKNYRKRH